MRKEASQFSSRRYLCACICLLAFGCICVCATRTHGFDRSAVLPEGKGPQYPVGNQQLRSFVVSADIPSESRQPVIVAAKSRAVLYLDGASLEPIEERTYPENEKVKISRNGKYISVFSLLRNRRTGKTLQKVRIEDWTGNRLWDMEYHGMGLSEPLPDGGFVVYPTIDPERDPMLLDGWPDPDFHPPPEAHGLRVYDPTGGLVLEGVSHKECRSMFSLGSVSADGGHLAFLFRWIPPDRRSVRGLDAGDRACLVLYSLEEHREIWRHHFEGRKPVALEMGPHAERIACVVSTTTTETGEDTDYHLFLMDVQGKLIAEDSIARYDDVVGSAHPRGLQFSEDGLYLCYWTPDSMIRTLRTEDGSELWNWRSPSRSLAIRSVSLGLHGKALVIADVTDGQGPDAESSFLEVSDGRSRSKELPSGFNHRGAGVHVGLIGDGSSYWLSDGRLIWLSALQE